MGRVAGVFDNPPGFPCTPPGVDVLEGGKLTSNNVAGSSHDPLQSPAVASGAVSKPGGDAAGQDALHSAGVEGSEDAGARSKLPQPSQEEEALMCLLQHCICVSRPCEILGDVKPEELKDVNPLHRCLVDGCVFSALSPVIHHQLLGLVDVKWEVVLLTPFSQGTHLLSVGHLIVVGDQAYHRCVIGIFDDDVGAVCCWARWLSLDHSRHPGFCEANNTAVPCFSLVWDARPQFAEFVIQWLNVSQQNCWETRSESTASQSDENASSLPSFRRRRRFLDCATQTIVHWIVHRHGIRALCLGHAIEEMPPTLITSRTQSPVCVARQRNQCLKVCHYRRQLY